MKTKDELLKRLEQVKKELEQELSYTYKDNFIIYYCNEEIKEIEEELKKFN